MKPLYLHDCDNCLYCGTVFDKDYYICCNGGFPTTVIERHSDEGGDYVSFSVPQFAEEDFFIKRYPIMYAIYHEWNSSHKEKK